MQSSASIVDCALRRLGTGRICLFQIRGFDAATPVEDTLHTLDDLVAADKIRYVSCSNFSGWHFLKLQAVQARYGWARYVARQAHSSLVGRHYAWALMPLALDQGDGYVVLSPLGWGRTVGRDGYRRHPVRYPLRGDPEALGWSLAPEQVARLNLARAVPRSYPYWHQADFAERNPFPGAD